MLLMAGSAFADNYLYMDDIVLTKNFVEQSGNKARQINVPVKAHFEQWTNAFDVTFDYGTIECRGVATQTVDGEEVPITPDMVLKGMNKNGVVVNIPVALNSNADADHFIAANSVGGYYYPEGSDPDEDDPIQYGAVKWAPGDYECMFMLILRIPQNFESGDITISTKFASGADTRPGVETIPAVYANTPTVKVAHVSVIDNTPTISDDGEKVTAVFNGATTNVKLYLKNGEEWVEVDNPYTLPEATDVDQVLVFKAITVPAEGAEGQLPAESEEYTVTIKAATPELQPAPVPTITDDGTKVTAAIAGDTQHTYVLELWNAETETWGEVANPYTLPAATFETQVLKFRAKTKAIEDVDSEDSEYCAEYTVTIDPKADNQAPAPTFRVDGDKLYAEKGDLTVELYKKDGENWVKVDNPYEGLPTENTSYTDDIKIEFKAITIADGVTYNINSDEATYTYEIPALTKKTAQKPTIEGANLTNDTYDIVITPDANTDGTLQYTVDVEGTVVRAGATTIRYERKDADYPVHVTAYTTEGATYKKSETAEADIVIPAKPAPNVYETPAPTINVDTDTENQKVIITVTGEGTVTAAVETAEGTKNYTDEDGDGKIVIEIPFGEEADIANVTATALATVVPDGYDVISETPGTNKKENIDIPALPEKTAKPTITYEYGKATWDADGNLVEDGRYATITITNNDEGENVVIEYSLDGGETWLTYNPERPVTIAGEGTYTVMARAQAEGKRVSDPATETIKIDKATSVNELVNGKTVAGVRYFNMAGQEMQEANGITIVVTTYTDGTTSAVKVIK